MKRKSVFAFVAFLSVVVMFTLMAAYEQDIISLGRFCMFSAANVAIGCLSAKKAGLFYE